MKASSLTGLCLDVKKIRFAGVCLAPGRSPWETGSWKVLIGGLFFWLSVKKKKKKRLTRGQGSDLCCST